MVTCPSTALGGVSVWRTTILTSVMNAFLPPTRLAVSMVVAYEVSSFQWPSETTSTVPPSTLMAVWSSRA